MQGLKPLFLRALDAALKRRSSTLVRAVVECAGLRITQAHVAFAKCACPLHPVRGGRIEKALQLAKALRQSLRRGGFVGVVFVLLVLFQKVEEAFFLALVRCGGLVRTLGWSRGRLLLTVGRLRLGLGILFENVKDAVMLLGI